MGVIKFFCKDKKSSLDYAYMGVCYYTGKGVEQNYDKAVTSFRIAAEQGHKEAQYFLGLCYYNGNGLKQDYNEAAKWYSKAADQGRIMYQGL
ncbi:MAG: tetratricopeptide repeat protein [Eubacteriaceae bacterium]